MQAEAPPPPPAAEPVIPPEVIKALYVETLENRLDQSEIDKAQDALNQRAEALKGKYLALFRERGLDPAEYTINMKTGVVTRKPAPGPRAVEAPAETSAPAAT